MGAGGLPRIVTDATARIWMSGESLALFRRLLRELRVSPLPPPVVRKARFNARQLWQFYSKAGDPELVLALQQEARAALRLLRWCGSLPQVRGGAGGVPQIAPRPLQAPPVPHLPRRQTAGAACRRPVAHPPLLPPPTARPPPPRAGAL